MTNAHGLEGTMTCQRNKIGDEGLVHMIKDMLFLYLKNTMIQEGHATTSCKTNQ